MREFDIIVAGGGAAGIMAAGVAAGMGSRVLLCEKMEKPQRKVRITGKGRCNLTNIKPRAEFLAKVRSGAGFFESAFSRFDNLQTVAFFEKIGVPLSIERGGRVFAASSKAWDIADAHIKWCREAGAVIECGVSVENIETRNGQVIAAMLRTHSGERERVLCRCAIIATGGLSYPATGSTGKGLAMAHDLGHTIIEVRPSLTPLETFPAPPAQLKGLALRNISATLLIGSKEAATEFGEMEFTDSGVSGPIILKLSLMAVDAIIDGRKTVITLDLKPALSTEQITARIGREVEKLPATAGMITLMGKLLPSAMIAFFLKKAGIPASLSARRLSPGLIAGIATLLKSFALEIVDYRPFEEAIVTAGGVCLEEVDAKTCGSKLIRGLYFAGEVLDIDADTGGYNLQIAYSTGHCAGVAAGESIKTSAR